MAKFDELIEQIKTDNPELADNLSTAYLDDMESRDAKITGLEKTISERDAKISVYAQENYDLMRAQPLNNDDDDDKPEPVKALATLDDVALHWRNK